VPAKLNNGDNIDPGDTMDKMKNEQNIDPIN
jgi:hypothetical protein